MTNPPFDIDRLSAAERIELAEKLWDSLRNAPEDLPLTTAQAEELDRRLAAYREDGDPGEPWRAALAKIGRGTTG